MLSSFVWLGFPRHRIYLQWLEVAERRRALGNADLRALESGFLGLRSKWELAGEKLEKRRDASRREAELKANKADQEAGLTDYRVQEATVKRDADVAAFVSLHSELAGVDLDGELKSLTSATSERTRRCVSF